MNKAPLLTKKENRRLRRIVQGRSPYTTLRRLEFICPTAIVDVHVQRAHVEDITRIMESMGFQLSTAGRAARHFFELKLRKRVQP